MANCSVCGRKMPGFSFGKPKCVWCLRHEAAQRGELTDDIPQPMMPVPWERTTSVSPTLTYILVGMNVLVFIAMGAGGVSLSDPSGQDLFRLGANYGVATLRGDWWRLITYNFLHAGFLHIGFNMWCLWDLGALAESIYGTWTFAAMYMICGVAGGLMSTAWNPVNLTVGASGAIFGLAGALIAGFYLGEFTIPKPVIQMQLRSLIIFVLFNVVLGVFSGYTDNACHFGGIAAGLVVGAAIAKFAPSPRDGLRRVVILVVMALVLFGAYRGLQRAHGIGRSVLGEAFQEKAFQEKAFQEKAFQDKAFQDKAFQEKAFQERAFQEKGFKNTASREAFRNQAFRKTSEKSPQPKCMLEVRPDVETPFLETPFLETLFPETPYLETPFSISSTLLKSSSVSTPTVSKAVSAT